MFDWIEDTFSDLNNFMGGGWGLNSAFDSFRIGAAGTYEVFSEVSGGNAMKRALEDQKNALREAAIKQEEMRLAEQQRQWEQDRQASLAAGAAQRRALAPSGGQGSKMSSPDVAFSPADLYIGGR